MRHYVIAGALVVLIGAATYFGLMAIGLMPVEASAQSIPIDQLWNLEVATISFLFALIVVPLVYSLIVFRRRKGDTTDAEHIDGNTSLEVTWTVIPLVIVVVFAYLGSYSLRETRKVDPNALVIKVTARQWDWTFEYPQGFATNELHLPINKQVVLEMTSTDVIHSFWVPEFRIKQDVVPGRVTEYRINPILAGRYTVRCAELCGASHAYMERPVIVSSAGEYEAWVNQQAATAAAAAAQGGPENGKLLVAAKGCSGCHSVDGTRSVGPTWQGLFNSTVKLADGTTVTANDAYLHESIVDPGAKVVDTFPAELMPSYKDTLTDAQLNDVISYIKTLK